MTDELLTLIRAIEETHGPEEAERLALLMGIRIEWESYEDTVPLSLMPISTGLAASAIN